MIKGLWSLWAKGRAVGNAKRFPRQAPRCPKGIVHKSTAQFGFSTAAQPDDPLGPKPVEKPIARSGRCSSQRPNG